MKRETEKRQPFRTPGPALETQLKERVQEVIRIHMQLRNMLQKGEHKSKNLDQAREGQIR